MLPINVLGNWCIVKTPLSEVDRVLHTYNEQSAFRVCNSGAMWVSWVDRSSVTFGRTRWYSLEGPLLLEGYRALLYKEDPKDPDKTHLILLGVLASSLVHLKNNVSSLFHSYLKSEIDSIDIRLETIARPLLLEKMIIGFGALNNEGDRYLTFQKRIDDQLNWLLDNASEPSEGSPHAYFLSELYLGISERSTELVLSRDGSMSFGNPEVSLDEIDDLFSLLLKLYRYSRNEDARQYNTIESKER